MPVIAGGAEEVVSCRKTALSARTGLLAMCSTDAQAAEGVVVDAMVLRAVYPVLEEGTTKPFKIRLAFL